MNIQQKITTMMASGAIIVSSLTPPAFAATSVSSTGNGSRSNNDISLSQDNRINVNQQSDAFSNNNIRLNSQTGNNRVSNNTNGEVFLGTGDTSSSVRISNQANINSFSMGHSNTGNGGSNNGHDNNQSHMLRTSLTGSEEVPGPGDSNGMGRARVQVRPNPKEICVILRIQNIEPATAAHIHEAAKGQSGPVVVTLPKPNANGFVSGCVAVSEELAREILAKPSDYYVNVHNPTFPNGAVRGQLSR